MNYYKCNGKITASSLYSDDIIIKAANKDDAQKLFEHHLSDKFDIEDFEAEEQDPDTLEFMAVNE